jgi:hypothetical protein
MSGTNLCHVLRMLDIIYYVRHKLMSGSTYVKSFCALYYVRFVTCICRSAQGFDPNNMTEQELRSQKNLPDIYMPAFRTFIQNPYSMALDNNPDTYWVTESLPVHAIWGIQKPEDFSLMVNCITASPDVWDIHVDGNDTMYTF